MRRITHGPQSYYNDSISYGHSLHSQCSYEASQNVISEGFITLKITAFVRNSMHESCDELKTYVHEKGIVGGKFYLYNVPEHCTCTLYALTSILQRAISTDIDVNIFNWTWIPSLELQNYFEIRK